MAPESIGRIHLTTTGATGPAIVLLPPNPLDGTSWLFQAAHLSAWYRILAVDLPGYGHSDPLTGPVSMADLAQAIWDTVRGVGVEEAVLAGVSIGGALALHMARTAPERTRGLIISGSGYRTHKAFVDTRIAGYRRDGLAYRRQHLLDGHAPGFLETDTGRYLAEVAQAREHLVDVPSVIRLFEAMRPPDPEDLFQPRCPALIVSGTLDYAHEASRALHERVPDSRFVTLDGAGHACHLERPAEWDAAALSFLAEVLGTPST